MTKNNPASLYQAMLDNPLFAVVTYALTSRRGMQLMGILKGIQRCEE
jgi:hypothetical protein